MIFDIRQLNARDLDTLLALETAEWNEKLDWDFSKSARLIRDLHAAQQLSGAALREQGEAAGYGYVGIDGHKAVIAGVWVKPASREGGAEAALIRVLLDTLIEISSVRRVESQLMLTDARTALEFQRDRPVQLYERALMTIDTSALPPPVLSRHRIEPWTGAGCSAAADVIARGYAGHIDAQISEQYRSMAQADRFLQNVVQFPGSATFSPGASYSARDPVTAQPAGFVLSSFIAPDVAHISEICVAPQARGTGLGYALLQSAMDALRQTGAKRVSLAVTAANHAALRLYHRFGFREMRRFYAFVWESSQASARNDAASG